MALRDLKAELEDWKALLFISKEEAAKLKAKGQKKSGSDDAFRDLLNSFEQEFYVDKKETAEEIYKRAPDYKTDPKKKARTEEFAQECVALARTFFSTIKMSSYRWMLQNPIVATSSNRTTVILLVDADSDAKSVFNLLRKFRTEKVNSLAETKYTDIFGDKADVDNPFSKWASKAKGTRNWNIFDIGHKHDVVRAKVATTIGKLETGATGDDPIRELRDELKTNLVKELVTTNEIELEHYQDFVDAGKTGLKFKDSFRVKSSLEDAVENQDRGAKSASIGKGLSSFIDRAIKRIESEYNDAEKGSTRARSDTLNDLAYKAIIMNKTMRNLYAKGVAKNLTNYKTAGKKKPVVKVTAAEKIKRKRVRITGFKVSGQITKEGTKKNRGNQELTNVAATRAFINTRLREQVVKNMGRPALTNRTGRFASSVEVVNAVPQRDGGIQMDYTYEKNPYQTFEAGGNYSPMYDPRGIIEKSIRELAAQRLETKFTLRRV